MKEDVKDLPDKIPHKEKKVITTEGGQLSRNIGRISLVPHVPQSKSLHLVHVDIIVEAKDGTEISLDRIDSDKIITSLQEIRKEVGRELGD